MIHHFRSAFRYLNRNRIATTINVLGLAIALSAAFLMLQYLDFELSYDTHLPEHKSVYRIATEKSGGATSETFYAVGGWVTETFPEVIASTRFYRWPANTGVNIESDGKLFNVKNYLYSDKGFFNVFPSLLIAGNPATCLAEPNSVVISERLANEIFGTTDVLGKNVVNPERRNKIETITGVFKNVPSNSQFEMDVMRPEEWIPEADWQWKSTTWTYIRVDDGTDPMILGAKMNEGLLPLLKEKATVWLQPMASIHLGSNLQSEIKAPGSMINIYMVAAALIMVLTIAWINYVNLETARFIKRLKEVGIRRIIGSSRWALLARFSIEFLIVTISAVVLASVIVTTTFAWFGYITGSPLTTFSFSVTSLWSITIVSMLVATIIAGAYPFISVLKINPVTTLKGQVIMRSSIVRRSLLTFQFVASLTLMALVVMVSFQLDFMRGVNMNFDKQNVVTIYNPANYTYMEDSLREGKNQVFRNKLMQIPSVSALTTSSAIPGEPIGFTYTDLAKRSMSDPDRQVHYKVMYIDYDFIPMFGLEILAGRNYAPEYSDEMCIVVTESTVRELGFTSVEEALNQKIHFNEPDDWHLWTIIGIVKDYKHESIKTAANPGIFRLHRNKGQMVYYSVKMQPGADATTVVPAIEKIWRETWPGKPFDFFFMDQHYDQQYKSEIHFSRVFTLFSGVAVFIACLGIMGMTLFEANARIKEIGIRKVLGAEVKNIVLLLMKNSLQLLIFSLVAVVPLVFVLANQWLTNYPERIEFSFWFVAAPFAVMLMLVILTSVTQILKTALKNPVESLKHE